MRPIEVGLAEPAALGDQCCECGGRLVDDVGLGGGGDGGAKGVDRSELVELRGFGDGLPMEGIDGVRAGEDARDGGSVVVVVLSELKGLLVFEGAKAPERDDSQESEDGPATSAKGWSACAYFAVDEAEEGWGDERDEQQEEDEGFEDEDEGAGVPVGVEGKEGANAVVVGPVEQDVAEKGDEGEAVEEAPADRGLWSGDVGGGGVEGLVGDGVRMGLFSVRAPAVEEPDGADDDGGFERYADEGVGDAAVVLEGCDGAAYGPEGVEVGGFGGDRHRDGGVGSLAVEAGAGEDGSRHEVGDGFHS